MASRKPLASFPISSWPITSFPISKAMKFAGASEETKLAKLLGRSQPLVSLLLSGKRDLSKENVKKLAAHFKLDAGYFL